MTTESEADSTKGASPGDPLAEGAHAEGAHAEGTAAAPATQLAARYSRRWLIGALATGLAVGGGGGFAGAYFYMRPTAPPRKPLMPAFVPLGPHSPRMGPDPAKVTIVEFTDFQCPFCNRARLTVHELQSERAADVAIVLRHRPLVFHKQARPAAIALQAANRQGKAWQLYPMLFENSKALQREDLLQYAGGLGIDLAKFEKDLDDPELAKEVDEDGAIADKIGASSTPTFYVNGRGVRGAKAKGVFQEAIDEELAAVDALLAGGMPLGDVYAARCEANVKAGPRA